MQYWTVENGMRLGPFTAQELCQRGTGPDDLVWFPGLTSWVPARNVSEIADVCRAAAQQATPPPPPPPSVPQSQPQPQGPAEPLADAPSQGVGESPCGSMDVPESPCPPPQSPHQTAAQAPAKMPSTYLAWSIVAAIIFNTILGIIAIIYSCQVQPRWRCADYAGAQQASTTAGWLVVVSVALGVIGWVFLMAFLVPLLCSLD